MTENAVTVSQFVTNLAPLRPVVLLLLVATLTPRQWIPATVLLAAVLLCATLLLTALTVFEVRLLKRNGNFLAAAVVIFRRK